MSSKLLVKTYAKACSISGKPLHVPLCTKSRFPSVTNLSIPSTNTECKYTPTMHRPVLTNTTLLYKKKEFQTAEQPFILVWVPSSIS
jgi:hypothetical protein